MDIIDRFPTCLGIPEITSWTDYTLFGYISGILFLLGIIYIPTLVATGYTKTNKKVFWRLVIGTIVFGSLFVLYTEEQMVEYGGGCGPKPTANVKFFPDNFFDVTPVKFPDVNEATKHIFLQ